MKFQKSNTDNIDFLGSRILIIAAHPDDDILGCGGMLAKLQKKKIDIKVIFIAEGSSCRYISSDDSNKINFEIQKRNKYAHLALKSLGIHQISFYNLKCGSLDTYPIIEIGKIIESEIYNFKPETIFTHSKNDLNNDHKIIYRSTLQATRPAALNYVKRIFSYEVISSSEWNFDSAFHPNYFINLSKSELNKKIKAFKFYISEIKKYPFARSEDSIISLARYRGVQSGKEFAESFRLIRALP